MTLPIILFPIISHALFLFLLWVVAFKIQIWPKWKHTFLHMWVYPSSLKRLMGKPARWASSMNIWICEYNISNYINTIDACTYLNFWICSTDDITCISGRRCIPGRFMLITLWLSPSVLYEVLGLFSLLGPFSNLPIGMCWYQWA